MTYEERLKGLGLFSLQSLEVLINFKDVKKYMILQRVINCPLPGWG